MTVTEIVCPSCNAPLPAVENKGFMFCPYCGHQVFLDDETVKVRFENAYEAGREFERGRQSVGDRGPNIDLAKKIVNTKNKLITIERLRTELNTAECSSPTVVEEKKNPIALWVVIAIVLIFVFRIQAGIGILLLLSCVAYYVITGKANKQKQQQTNAEAANRATEIASLREQYDEAVRSGFDLSLPQKYLKVSVLDQLHTIIMSERAYTLQQAINYYEDDLHNKELERIARDQLEMQKKQLEMMDKNSARCPYCGSSQVQAVKKGFGVGKAVAGAVLLGPVGVLGGAIGSNKVQRVCLSCGKKF